MRKALRLMMIILMIMGITLSMLNFISVDNMAYDPGDPVAVGAGRTKGSQQNDGCHGPPLNCYY